jgi:preprotein translocase subunit YajC
MLFITPAYAQSAPGADPLTSLLVPLALMLPIFYFLVIRPNQQREKSRRELLSNIRRGDTVVLSNGFIGRVTKVKDTEPELEVEFSDTMRLRVARGYIAEVRAKGEPVKEAT